MGALRLTLAAFLWAIFFGAPAASAAPADVEIVLYHTNDIHGWIMSRPSPLSKKENPPIIGGFAALANLVRAETKPKLLLDAGDWFQGTPEGTLTKGDSLVDCFNALGYDAIEAGNHDFDLGVANLERLVSGLKAPVLGANAYRGGKRLLMPAIIKEVSGVKFGIFGLLTSNMPNLTFKKTIEGFSFRREADEAREQVRELKKQGADVIIAVTHVGLNRARVREALEDDEYIAAHVAGIDVIVGGHSHTVLEKPLREMTNGTWILQAGTGLTRAGQARLLIDSQTHKLKDVDARLIDLWVDRYGEAKDLLDILARYEQRIGTQLDVVIATASATLTRNRAAESSLGDWMADCMREYGNTELAFMNSGGIRADLAAGPVTLRHIFQVMPFDNALVTMKLDAAAVREVLEHGVSGRAGILQWSGGELRYRPSLPMDERLTSIRVGGAPLKAGRAYSIAAPDFIAQSGDGYGGFSKGSDKVYTGVLVRDVLSSCARKHPAIGVPAGGRIVEE